MQFQYMIHMAMPQYKNPCPRGDEIYNLGRPFHGHHYHILSIIQAREKIFREIHQFYTFDPKIISLEGGLGMKFTIVCPLAYPNLSLEGVVRFTPTPLLTSKLQESCKIYIIHISLQNLQILVKKIKNPNLLNIF